MVAVRVIITGQVQGVGFRYFATDLAHRYSLCGWIRNLATGDVEVLVEGAKGSVSGFLRELRIGPRHAFISNFQVEWKDYEGKFDSFTVRY